jgi:tetratricopeptide (TPR) repeat protein
MKNATKFVLSLVALALVLLAPAAAQQSGQQPPPTQGQQQQPPPAQGQQPPAEPPKPAVNPEEEKAYEAFFKLGRTDIEATIQQGDDFLKTYPASVYTGAVHQKVATAHFYKNNLDKFLEHGNKAIESNPDNVDILPMLALVLPRRVDPSSLDAPQKLTKAEGYAKRAIELLNAMPKPEGLTQEDFDKAKNEKISMCRSGLGLVYFQRARYADAAAELEQATKIVANPDPSDIYILAVAYQQAKRFTDAVAAYDRCSQITWAWQERCKSGLADSKKQAASQPPSKQP